MVGLQRTKKTSLLQPKHPTPTKHHTNRQQQIQPRRGAINPHTNKKHLPPHNNPTKTTPPQNDKQQLKQINKKQEQTPTEPTTQTK